MYHGSFELLEKKQVLAAHAFSHVRKGFRPRLPGPRPKPLDSEHSALPKNLEGSRYPRGKFPESESRKAGRSLPRYHYISPVLSTSVIVHQSILKDGFRISKLLLTEVTAQGSTPLRDSSLATVHKALFRKSLRRAAVICQRSLRRRKEVWS
jgi:hypothetical protein